MFFELTRKDKDLVAERAIMFFELELHKETRTLYQNCAIVSMFQPLEGVRLRRIYQEQAVPDPHHHRHHTPHSPIYSHLRSQSYLSHPPCQPASTPIHLSQPTNIYTR
ncbi:hypothetical protein CONLIGDRAFT_627523 [Coniochaeta ligniaria NRRL 30616]|uniref:Uncharacterized protein n=1 Tax=Coniochaeta ligniaria NRRL 30616 TaxID=1408157 RepID=A0A1J7J7P3_9PEZI|nr:hypothetical protein CONLIGDRAFT_627523 [Coniochaeta ligniaria NRRL 30616]